MSDPEKMKFNICLQVSRLRVLWRHEDRRVGRLKKSLLEEQSSRSFDRHLYAFKVRFSLVYVLIAGQFLFLSRLNERKTASSWSRALPVHTIFFRLSYSIYLCSTFHCVFAIDSNLKSSGFLFYSRTFCDRRFADPHTS